MNYTKDLYRDIILDHAENPRNLNKNINDKYKSAYLKNPSCGDEITIYVKENNSNIDDITYKVSGCSICKSSTSVMSDLLIGKTIKETKEIITNINQMLVGNDYKEELLKDAIIFEGIKNLPPRIKCALLPYNAYIKALGDKYE